MPRGGQTRELSCVCGDCRTCKHRSYMAEWTAANPERARQIAADSYARHAEAVRARARAYRAANIEAARAYDRARGHRSYGKQKDAARKALWNALKRGEIVREPCEVCGATTVDGHHEDYSKPLEVRWLCRTHHMKIHRRIA